MKSCYILEFSVRSASARHAEVYVYETLTAIHHRVHHALFGEPVPSAEAFVVSYVLSDPTLGVWVVQRGQVTQFADLRPFVAIVDRDGHAMPLGDPAGLAALRHLIASDPDHPVTLAIDWTAFAAPLPPLEAPLLAPEETTEVTLDPGLIPATGTYLVSGEVEHGSWDLVTGENLDASDDEESVRIVDDDE